MSLRIAIVGAGAIGGYLGVKLALAGHDITFIARGANLQAIAQHGMKLQLEDGSELHARDVKACRHRQCFNLRLRVGHTQIAPSGSSCC